MPAETAITASELYERFGRTLGLRWVAGRSGAGRRLFPEGEPGRSPVGHINFIHPHVIQVVGETELAYLDDLGQNSYRDILKQLFGGDGSVVIIADGLEVPQALQERAEETGTPLFASTLESSRLIQNVHYFFGHLQAEKTTIHGVFMEVIGIGVLITGEAGVGKSELALELITRRHRLVADDVPEFARVAPDVISGTCPEPLRDFIEVRGLGVLNVRAMFGDSAIRERKKLDLIVNLLPLADTRGVYEEDRLTGTRRNRTLLDIEIPELDLPVAPGRNLAVLVEAAARNEVLRFSGYDAAQDFERRHQRMMRDDQG